MWAAACQPAHAVSSALGHSLDAPSPHTEACTDPPVHGSEDPRSSDAGIDRCERKRPAGRRRCSSAMSRPTGRGRNGSPGISPSAGTTPRWRPGTPYPVRAAPPGLTTIDLVGLDEQAAVAELATDYARRTTRDGDGIGDPAAGSAVSCSTPRTPTSRPDRMPGSATPTIASASLAPPVEAGSRLGRSTLISARRRSARPIGPCATSPGHRCSSVVAFPSEQDGKSLGRGAPPRRFDNKDVSSKPSHSANNSLIARRCS